MSYKFSKENFEEIKNLSIDEGFDLVGITKPVLQERDKEFLKEFIDNKKYHRMEWFSNYKEIRLEPFQILKDCKSVFVFAIYYKNRNYDNFIKNSRIKISRYAAGKDYHKVLKKKLKEIDKFLKKKFPDIQTRITVDSAPVPEKILAKKAGIGWQGKNTNIIHPDLGSYFFLGCIFTNFEYSEGIVVTEIKDHCKGCQLCIQACPTKALEPYRLSIEKCISYWNIESRIDLPYEIAKKSNGWIFGCDICQEVCPFNRNKHIINLTTNVKEFEPRKEIYFILENLPDENFWIKFQNTPLKRVSYQQFIKNYKQILKINSYEYRV